MYVLQKSITANQRLYLKKIGRVKLSRRRGKKSNTGTLRRHHKSLPDFYEEGEAGVIDFPREEEGLRRLCAPIKIPEKFDLICALAEESRRPELAKEAAAASVGHCSSGLR